MNLSPDFERHMAELDLDALRSFAADASADDPEHLLRLLNLAHGRMTSLRAYAKRCLKRAAALRATAGA